MKTGDKETIAFHFDVDEMSSIVNRNVNIWCFYCHEESSFMHRSSRSVIHCGPASVLVCLFFICVCSLSGFVCFL